MLNLVPLNGLLLLAGSAMHYVAVLNFVIPGGPGD